VFAFISGFDQNLHFTGHYPAMSVSLSLEGQVALITGGSRGIGAAAVRMFVQAGARVAFNYQKAEAEADKIVRACGEDKCTAIKCSLEGTETAAGLVAATVKQFGRLDILIANHGIWPPDDAGVEDMTDEQWRHTVAVNLDSVFALVKHSVAEMKKTATNVSPAHIVLVSSTAGQRGEAFHVDYAATKGALISMVKGLSTELAPHHIYVNCVAPGWVGTDMSKPALRDPSLATAILAKIPLGRVGTPEELAAPILFLCTPLAGFITGEVMNVNGGAVLVG
jgi:3-oxoacyl-[acyl-carrier protein] reductase